MLLTEMHLWGGMETLEKHFCTKMLSDSNFQALQPPLMYIFYAGNEQDFYLCVPEALK